MSNFTASLVVSAIAMSVIFLTLAMLIILIRVLVAWYPYQEPPPSQKKPNPSATTPPHHIAAIHAAVALYLGKAPHEIQTHNIKPL